MLAILFVRSTTTDASIVNVQALEERDSTNDVRVGDIVCVKVDAVYTPYGDMQVCVYVCVRVCTCGCMYGCVGVCLCIRACVYVWRMDTVCTIYTL